MSWKRSERKNAEGLYEIEWNVPIIGVDTYSGDTRLFDGHIAFTQNAGFTGGRPEALNGYSLLDTVMDADDNATPQGFGQYRSGSTETYIIVQQSGRVASWNAAANTWTQLHTGMTSDAGIDVTWNELNYAGYLIFGNPTDGNWKYDGSNWLPLGARLISDCESDQDGQWANETAETTVVREGAQSYSRAVAAGATQTLVFTPTANLDLSTGLLSAKAYTEANATIGFFFRTTDASEITTATSFFEIATSSGVHELQEPLSEWIDHATGAVVVLADNTWFRIEIPLDAMTETGTFNLADIDTLTVSITAPAGTGQTHYVDCFYIIYDRTDRMPGVETMAVWNDVLLGAGATATGQEPSDLHFAPVGAPDEYAATAFISVNPDAGGPIRVIRRFFNQVFIGKENSCHSLGGTTAGTTYPNFNYEILDVTGQHGADGHRSLVEKDKKLFFPWRNRYYEYDGTGTVEIGDRIQPDLRDHAPTLLRQKTAALYQREGEIWTAYPGNGDTNNTRLFKYDGKGFTGVEDDAAALNLNILKSVQESGLEKIIGIDEAGDIMWLDDSAVMTHDGTASVRIVRFPWVSVEPDMMSFWKEVVVLFESQAASTITVQYRIADHPRAFAAASFVTASTVDLTAAGNLGWVHIGELGVWLQLQFTATSVMYDIQFPIILRAAPIGPWA